MSRNSFVRGLVAAAPRALLTLAFAGSLGAPAARAQDTMGSMHEKMPVPGSYKEDMCVASIAAGTNLVSFMPTNLEDPNAAVSFAFREAPKFKVGDLVRLRANDDPKAGQPNVDVREAGSSQCKRYVK